MARYLQTVEKLRQEVDGFLLKNPEACPVELGHIINLAVRCSPRAVQGTVRKNIVSGAMTNHCDVTMTKEPEGFNKIHIKVK